MIKKLIKEALFEFFKSEEGETLIGTIVLKAVNQALTKEMEYEDGKTDPGRTVVKKTEVNVLDQTLAYMASVEGAIRGCQSDAAKARNRAVETKELIGNLIERINNYGSVYEISQLRIGEMQRRPQVALRRSEGLLEQHSTGCGSNDNQSRPG